MRSRALVGVVLTVVLTGCPKKKSDDETLTAAEALQAVEESTLASQAENLTAASVEITTSFTIGQAVQNAAQEIQAFIENQLPCAQVTLADATLTVEYGANPGMSCTYRGQTLSGSHAVKVSKNDQAEVIVEHTWTGLSNGRVTLDGTATVTWSVQDKTRHVEHTAVWTRVADGFQVTGQGNRTQSVLEGGLVEGIKVDGDRSWTSTRGKWDLSIEGVEMRWVDPVPQAGSYTLLTPKQKMLSLSFSRVDQDTIQVTVTNGKRSFSFDVTKAGAVNDQQ